MGFIIVVAIIAMIIYLLIHSEKKEEEQAATPPADKAYMATVSSVIDFVKAYLSLCAKHEIFGSHISVAGTKVGNDIKIDVSALIYEIDGNDAVDVILALKNSCDNAISTEGLIAGVKTKLGLISDFYGTRDLPGYFYRIEDYEYEQGRNLYLKEEYTDFMRSGHTATATYEEIKRQVLEINPNAEVKVDSTGMAITLH